MSATYVFLILCYDNLLYCNELGAEIFCNAPDKPDRILIGHTIAARSSAQHWAETIGRGVCALSYC